MYIVSKWWELYTVNNVFVYNSYNILYWKKKMKLIGITGSIGCGKTTIADLIKKMGYIVFDADKWCRNLYNQKDFLDVIKQNFPHVFENGVFYKRKLRNYVFSNNKELKKLEAIIHPFLKKKLISVIKKNAKSDRLIFIEVALLFEMGWNKYCSSIIVADVDYEIQKQRVMKRDNISAQDFEKIVSVQLNNDYKKTLSDYVIDTDKTLNMLKIELINLIEGLS